MSIKLPRRTYVIVGAAFLFIGFFMILNTFQGFTGFAIFDNLTEGVSYTYSLWFLISGMAVLLLQNEMFGRRKFK